MKTTLHNANCLSEGHATEKPATVEVSGPVKDLSESDMIVLTCQRRLDAGVAIAAFARFGHPCNSSIRFVEDADGKVWACGPKPTFDSQAAQAAVAVATVTVMAARQRSKNHI